MHTGEVIDTSDLENPTTAAQERLQGKVNALPARPCKDPYCRQEVPSDATAKHRQFCDAGCHQRHSHRVADLRRLHGQISRNIDRGDTRNAIKMQPSLKEVERRLSLHGVQAESHLTAVATSAPITTNPRPVPERSSALLLRPVDQSSGHPLPLWTRLLERHAALEVLIRQADTRRQRNRDPISGLPDWQDPGSQDRMARLLMAVRNFTGGATTAAHDDDAQATA